MKMHLLNILNQHQASSTEKEIIQAQFKEGNVTHKAVVDAIEKLRQWPNHIEPTENSY